MPTPESALPKPPTEPELDSQQSFFFKAGLRNTDLANAYQTLFHLVQSLRPQAFEGYINTKSGFWYQATFGWMRSKNDESGKPIEAYRGYLQLDPQDIGRIMQQLSLIAIQRLRVSKRTEFKVMLGTNPEIAHKYQPKEPLTDEDLAKIGTYNDLSPNDTALVIYGESVAEVAEVLIALTQTRDYELMEKHFAQALTRARVVDFKSRGTTNITAPDGAILLSASMNALPGHMDDQVL